MSVSNMTNEEAIKIISETPVTYANPDEQGVWDEAIHLAIVALERVKSLEDENAFLKSMQRDLTSGMNEIDIGRMVRRNLIWRMN